MTAALPSLEGARNAMPSYTMFVFLLYLIGVLKKDSQASLFVAWRLLYLGLILELHYFRIALV